MACRTMTHIRRYIADTFTELPHGLRSYHTNSEKIKVVFEDLAYLDVQVCHVRLSLRCTHPPVGHVLEQEGKLRPQDNVYTPWRQHPVGEEHIESCSSSRSWHIYLLNRKPVPFLVYYRFPHIWRRVYEPPMFRLHGSCSCTNQAMERKYARESQTFECVLSTSVLGLGVGPD